MLHIILNLIQGIVYYTFVRICLNFTSIKISTSQFNNNILKKCTYSFILAGSCSIISKDSDWSGTGNSECCKEQGPCGEGEGDCDQDNECAGSLECGQDNCAWGMDPLGSWDDCCQDPATTTTSTTSCDSSSCGAGWQYDLYPNTPKILVCSKVLVNTLSQSDAIHTCKIDDAYLPDFISEEPSASKFREIFGTVVW